MTDYSDLKNRHQNAINSFEPLKNNYNIREELIMKFSFYFNNLLVKKVNRSIISIL